MPSRLLVLAAAALAASILVVELRHQSRALFAQLQSLRVEHDALNTEWGQLLLEEGTWSEHRRVEQLARMRLNMSIPGRDRIVVLRASEAAR